MNHTVVLLLGSALVLGTACKKKSNTQVVDPGDRTGAAGTSGNQRAPDRRADTPASGVTTRDGDAPASFTAVYFEFDASSLNEAARQELQRLGEWLQAHPGARVTIEGHADERGTDEYNLALGQRRAQVIQQYLLRLGVEGGRLATISFGEERPASAGDGEEAWTLDRRGELVTAP